MPIMGIELCRVLGNPIPIDVHSSCAPPRCLEFGLPRDKGSEAGIYLLIVLEIRRDQSRSRPGTIRDLPLAPPAVPLPEKGVDDVDDVGEASGPSSIDKLGSAAGPEKKEGKVNHGRAGKGGEDKLGFLLLPIPDPNEPTPLRRLEREKSIPTKKNPTTA